MSADTTPRVAFNYDAHVLRHQRTQRGLDFDVARAVHDELRHSDDPAAQARFALSNRALVHLRDVGTDVVHVDRPIAELSVRYQNDEYIGDRLLPIATVGSKSNLYWIYDERSQLGYPDSSMAGLDEAHEVNQTYTTGSYYCKPYGLKQTISVAEMDNADAPLDPLLDGTMLVADGLAFNREVSIASVLTTSSNFGANTTAVAAGSEWNSAGGGSPIALIRQAVDGIFGGMSQADLIGYCSVNVYRTLSTHPAIRALFQYQKEGFATPQMIASYFGLKDLLVGRARKDAANPGQTISVGRIWTDVFGIVRVAKSPSPRQYTFGSTFRWGSVNSTQTYYAEKGFNGNYVVKATVAEDYKVVSAKAGYLITACHDSTLP